MKALLVEDSGSKIKTRSAIILLPSGKIKPDPGDPANVVIEWEEENNLRVWTLNNDELTGSPVFKIIKEIEINGRLLLKALAYRNARIEYEHQKVILKRNLLNQTVAPNCDALSFLDMGPVIL